jgi:thymidylate kinase
VLITFSGLDGSGKSTLIEWLRVALEREGRSVVVLHMNEDVGVYAYLRRGRDRLLRLVGLEVPQPLQPGADPLDPSRPANRSWLRRVVRRVRYAVVWSETLRRCIYLIDLLVFALYRLAFEKLTKRVFIMDRYFYDTLVDLSEGGNSPWNRLLEALTPTPDMPVLLEVPPEQAFGRKGEYSVDYLRRRWVAYQTVLGWVPSCVKVANMELERTQAALWQVVATRMPRALEQHMAGLDRANGPQL